MYDPTPALADGSVGSAALACGAVGTGELADATVIDAKLADAAETGWVAAAQAFADTNAGWRLDVTAICTSLAP